MPIVPTPAQWQAVQTPSFPHSPTPAAAGTSPCSRKALQGVSPFSALTEKCAVFVRCATETLTANPEGLPPLRSAFWDLGKPRGLNGDVERVNSLHLKTVFGEWHRGLGQGRDSQVILPKGTSAAGRGFTGSEGTPATHGSGIAACAVPCQRKGKKLKKVQVPNARRGRRQRGSDAEVRCCPALSAEGSGSAASSIPCGSRDEPPGSGKT